MWETNSAMSRHAGVLDRSNVRTAPALVFAAVLGLALAPARAGNWPTPAAGGSASGDPEVLFTFDDGPHLKMTEQVLDILAERDIKAVFFMVGRRVQEGQAGQAAAGKPDRHKALIDRVLREGHIIANHSMSHPNLCLGKAEAAITEIDETRAILEDLIKMPVPWFRAPYGAWCQRIADAVAERDLRHWYWDIDPQEWKTRSGAITEKRVIAGLRRLRGRAVILLHDTQPATVQALPRILDWIDAENARREGAGKPRIRIVDAPDYALELLGPESVAEARALTDDLLGALAAGLAASLP